MPNKTQASQFPIGRRLRWARNVVKKWEKINFGRLVIVGDPDYEIALLVKKGRYERACALIVAQKLKQ